MKKLILACLFHLLFSGVTASAQITHTDSMVKQAKKDVRRFRMSREDAREFRENGKKYQAKFFRPKAENVSDPLLLKDRDYVETYTREAFYRAGRGPNAGTAVIVLAVALVGSIVALSMGIKALTP